VWCLLQVCAAHALEPLPRLAADLSQTTVSGISAGGFMAVQFHVAHSGLVRGVGVLAAGPYYCAQDSAWAARYNCMQPGAWTPLPDPAYLAGVAETLALAGQIDPTSNLRGARVWTFAGLRDDVVHPVVVEALDRFYATWVPKAQRVLVRGIEAGHAMVTQDFGSACEVTRAPFLNDCDYDAAGALLEHLLGRLRPRAATLSGELRRFDQREFALLPYAVSLAEEGFVYVPADCRSGGCRVHVAFHGCAQSEQAVGEEFVRNAGYNRWADTNRLIVLYPQTIARKGWGPWPWPTSFVLNPNGCWDWWGYTGPLYHTKAGAQIRAARAMLERLGSRME
jgi:poly(3-hydroxybutyrate) depolymerase